MQDRRPTNTEEPGRRSEHGSPTRIGLTHSTLAAVCEDVGGWIDRRFSTGVALETANITDQTEVLFPEERAVVRSSPQHRRAEFSTARMCARSALARLGGPQASLPAGPHGGPDWPQGYIGSLSHCHDAAVALVAKERHFASVGVDIEGVSPIPGRLAERIATAAEQTMLAQLSRTEPSVSWTLVLFSAKESAYKCYSQAASQRISLRDISIQVDINGSLLVWWVGTQSELSVGHAVPMKGLWTATSAHVVTVVWQLQSCLSHE